jgi:hypothetical protein
MGEIVRNPRIPKFKLAKNNMWQKYSIPTSKTGEELEKKISFLMKCKQNLYSY